MWPEGFDPANLTRDASLNKLVIGPAPGAHPEHVGEKGGDLLGRDAVVTLVQQRCGVVVPCDAVADWLVAAMAADPEGAAAAVVDEVGDRLASLIATLRDRATATATTGGRRTYLEVWQSLELVMLGGGLMKGVVGRRVAARVGAVLGAVGVRPPAVRVAQHPEWLSLLGAARSAAARDARVVVLDGGQTSIKRGIAVVDDGDLARMLICAPFPVMSIPPSRLPAVVAGAVAALKEHDGQTAPEVMVSVASYVRNGRPIADGSSIYERLDPRRMQVELGGPVRLVHDGSAAWRGTGVDTRSAVITLGTWLGVGMGPHREALRPYSETFTLYADGMGA